MIQTSLTAQKPGRTNITQKKNRITITGLDQFGHTPNTKYIFFIGKKKQKNIRISVYQGRELGVGKAIVIVAK